MLHHIEPAVGHLRSGRRLVLRNAVAGDEAVIAGLLVAAFPFYRYAAGGDLRHAVVSLTREISVESAIVAVLAETGVAVGVEMLRDSDYQAPHLFERLFTKFRYWGLPAGLKFVAGGLRAHFIWPRARLAPGDLYQASVVVDEGFRRLGVRSEMEKFVLSHARTSGYRTIWHYIVEDNQAALASAGRCGFTLTPQPPRPLARLLRAPGIVRAARSVPG